MNDGLRAAVHDPLWLLGRQGQVGEFEGEDTGSPVVADYTIDVDPLSRYAGGRLDEGTIGDPYDGTTPLEVLVERERIAIEPTNGRDEEDVAPGVFDRAVEAGGYFLRLLAAKDLDYGAADFPAHELETEPESDGEGDRHGAEPATRTALAGWTIDGVSFYRAANDALPDRNAVPRPTGLDPGDDGFETYIDAVIEFVSWYESLYAEPEPDESDAWDEDRFEYQFAVSTGADETESVFEATEYADGRLDWYAFDHVSGATLSDDPSEDAETDRIERTRVPTQIAFGGMPAARWWEFESGVNLARLEAAPEDLSRLALLEFALLAGDDWFLLPLSLPARSLARVHDLSITDTFGDEVPIGSTQVRDEDGTADWNAYGFPLEDETGLFLPPVLSGALKSEPVESVDLARDPVANVGWAVERMVEGRSGNPVRRAEAGYQPPSVQQTEPVTEPEVTSAGLDHRYRLSTDVPDYWYPLLPTTDELGHVVFELGSVLGDEERAPSRGKLLDGDRSVPDEEISDAGTAVTRSYQYAHGNAGGTYLWSGRRKMIGAEVGPSGLQFDTTKGTRRTGATGAEPRRLAIRAIYPQSAPDDLNQERVIFENVGPTALELGAWTVTDEANHEYSFPDGVTLNPSETIALRSGKGADSETDLYWGSETTIWSDDGDTVFVSDVDGRLVVKRSY